MFLLLLACDTTGPVDPDGDGFDSTEDCNNLDATVFPGAAEPCDGIDNDCNGVVDDASTDSPFAYADVDGDGFGDVHSAIAGCTLPAGWSREAGDCDDEDDNTFPGAGEACDGVDNDCDGLVDDACHAAPTGSVDVDASDFVVLAPCDKDSSADTVTLADADGDVIADVVAVEAYCAEEPLLKLTPGPLQPETDLWQAETEVTLDLPELTYGSSSTLLELDLGADVTGDGSGDLVITAGQGSGHDAIMARLYSGPVQAGLGASFEVWIEEAGAWTQFFALSPTLLEGEPGVVVLSLAGNPEGQASNGAVTYVVDGAASGNLAVASLGTLAESTDGSGLATVTRRAGDLDGDGIADLAQLMPTGIEYFLGPVSASQVGTPADGVLRVLGGGGRLSIIGCDAGDLDSDGTGDLIVAAISTYATEGGVFRTRVEAGVLLVDETPILALDDEVAWLSGARLLDVNGDAYLDVATGDEYYGADREDWGRACLDYGPFEGGRVACDGGLVVNGDDDRRYLGRRIVTGDTNADGFDDLLMTGPSGSENDPIAWGFLGGP